MANGKTHWRPAVKLGKLDVKASAPPIAESLDRPANDRSQGENVGAVNSKSHLYTDQNSIANGSVDIQSAKKHVIQFSGNERADV